MAADVLPLPLPVFLPFLLPPPMPCAPMPVRFRQLVT